MIEAARLFAMMFALLYGFTWTLWTCFGPANHTAIALIALAYSALAIECWEEVERRAADDPND